MAYDPTTDPANYGEEGQYLQGPLMKYVATNEMMKKSWWPSYLQSLQSGDPNQVVAWAQYVAPQFADFDGATDGEFVGHNVARMQGVRAIDKTQQGVTAGIGAGGLILGGLTAGEVFGAGAAGAAGTGAGDAAIAGGAGTDAMVGGATAGAGGTTAAGGAAATGLTDIGGGMAVDAAGNVVMAGAGTGVAGAGVGAGAGAGGVDIGSGMTVDQYGNVAGATGGAASGGILGGINPQLVGAGAGALLGGVAGGSKPAGTTTTTSDVPAWLMPYLTGNLNAAQGVRDSLAGNPTMTSAATPEYLKTINGDYLDPASNPYLDATYKHAAGLVGAGVDSRFEASGRYGSGAHQGVLQEGFNNLANTVYGGNYQAERARQVAAVTGAPSFDTGTATAAYAPYSQFNSLFPGNSRSTTTPYFTNTAGGILGGALAGSQLSRMFG